MTEFDHLDRDLVAWFGEQAVPRVPEYVDDIVRRTAPVRQRPRWTFPARWIPMTIIAFSGRTGRSVPWRAIGVLALVGLVLAATVAIYVGTRPRQPAPFGRAANGLVAFERDGDIYTADPVSGVTTPIVVGATQDHDPRFSRDGTRLAFLRDAGSGVAIVVADADGSAQQVVSDPFESVDPDGLAWSPDGRWIAINGAARNGQGGLFIVDATDGGARALAVDYGGLESYWRPDGTTLLFQGERNGTFGLFLVSPSSGHVEALPSTESAGMIRSQGWTPDGAAVVYQLEGDSEVNRTHVLDVSTGHETILPLGFGHVSNDGKLVVGFVDDRVCVVPVTGGDCRYVGDKVQAGYGTCSHCLFWSPDDQWIVVSGVLEDRLQLIDAVSGKAREGPWQGALAGSWQRIAR